MSKRKRNALLGTGALLLGTLLYVFLRKGTYIAGFFSENELVVRIQSYLENKPLDILRFYIPDYLWGLALCCGFHFIYEPDIKGSVLCGCAAFLCAGIWEALQYLGFVSGTGDLLDMLMYCAASLSGIIINLKERM